MRAHAFAALHRLWQLALTAVLMLALLAGAGWWWVGSEGSLAWAVQQLAPRLPVDQQLQAEGVRGNLRHGGHIGQLQWRYGDLLVQAQDVHIGWQPGELLQGQLRLDRLHLARLVVQDRRAPAPGPAQPPRTLGLPLRVDADLRIDRLDWQGASQWRVDDLAGSYIFDSYQHIIDKGQARFLSNAYTFTVRLQAQHAMDLAVALGARLQTQVPGRAAPLPLNLEARLQGTLADPQTRLTLHATLTPDATPTEHLAQGLRAGAATHTTSHTAAVTRSRAQAPLSPATGPTMAEAAQAAAPQAQLSAHIAPWQAHVVVDAQARWQGLNLGSLWPEAPLTLLAGAAELHPNGAGWAARISLANAREGPWDQQQLPLRTLQAQLAYLDGRWLLQSLQAELAGGRIDGQGHFEAANPSTGASPTAPAAASPTASSAGASPAAPPQPQGPAPRWQAKVALQGVSAQALDRRLPPLRLQGRLSAQRPSGDPAAGIDFDLDLQAITPEGARVNPVAVDAPASASDSAQAARPAIGRLALHAAGRWAEPLLSLSQLRLTDDAGLLQGHGSYHSLQQAAMVDVSAELPGLQGRVAGQLAPDAGAGQIKLQITQIEQLQKWLQRWPGLDQALGAVRGAQGQADLDARWAGGWGENGERLQIQASLSAPDLYIASAQARLNKLKLELTGAAASLDLQGSSHLLLGGRKLAWSGQAALARLADSRWQARLAQFQVDVLQDGGRDPWRVVLQPEPGSGAPVSLLWQSDPHTRQLSLSPGRLALTGPAAGQAWVSWQAAHWWQTGGPAGTAGQAGLRPAQWNTQGQIHQLPLAWIETLTRRTLADLGLRSDLLLGGQWEAAQSDGLHAQITLERQSGDLHLSAESGQTAGLAAGMREAWMQVNVDGEQVSGSLRWDSERAGRALLAVGTRLQHGAQGWTWSVQQPLAGSLQLDLPPMDAWSALAPPGWRLRGQVQTHIDLTGSIAQPQWSGLLRARNLALRSVVDGVDFSQGTLDARLQGQTLDIQNFTLRGARSASPGAAAGAGAPGLGADAAQAPDGGTLTLTGQALWTQAAHTDAPGQPSVRLDLHASLKGLRVSARPDRRLSVSGKLDLGLQGTQLRLQGDLAVDQALFTLPDDSTPKLGDDVAVRRTPAGQAAAARQGGAPGAAHAGPGGAADDARALAGRIRPVVAVKLDLGPDFQLRGRGLSTRLAGKLELSAAGLQPELSGNIRTVKGVYWAYGQKLSIERSLIRFYGPPDNPALSILAIRPNVSQRVGVQISGTALSPAVTLYAEPDLPEADKLAWLLLGRSPSGGGGETALLQQAAMALLGSDGQSLSQNLGQTLGLDELSLGGRRQTGADAAGSNATLTLGKRLSDDVYLTYENSLNGTMGVFYIFYDLTRRLTLRAQAGEQSAIDLVYTLRYD